MKRERILIIDDNKDDAMLVRRLLEQRSNYEVRYASSGDEGLKMAREEVPDCILVDYRMPGMDGFEVSRLVKSDPRLRTVPILMLTGADAPQNLVDGLEAGADDYVTKGSDMDVIMARVKALLRVKAYQDQILRLYEEKAEANERITALNNRLNSDLQFARRVQEALLPPRSFSSSEVEIRSAYIPSDTLSGDFYDYFTMGDALYVFMADVSGHGLPAAILVSLLKSYLHSEADDSGSTAGFMAALNEFLFTASLPSQFATAQLFMFEAHQHAMRVTNAAHPPFLLYQKTLRKVVSFEQPGHLLGAMTNREYDELRIPISSGDIFFSYTDGLTDRRTAEGEFYSTDRIARIMEDNDGPNLELLYDKVYTDVTAFKATDEFKDDIAFILTRFR